MITLSVGFAASSPRVGAKVFIRHGAAVPGGVRSSKVLIDCCNFPKTSQSLRVSRRLLFLLYFVSRLTVFPGISSPETIIRSTRVVLGCSIRLISRSAAILPRASVS